MNKLVVFSSCLVFSGLFLLAATFAFNPETPATADKAVLRKSFVGTRWQMTDFKLEQDIDLDGDGKFDTDLISFLKPCERDNVVVFGADGTLSVEEGERKCARNTGLTTPSLGTWRYDKQSNKLIIVHPGSRQAVSWQVVEFSETHLKVKLINPQEGPASAAVVTWKSV